uniref:SECIS binding protein 2 n=1 Tax=Varanus komodoensis TaxID=61221 RepID=A0A8D2KVZ2_VARKO
MAHNGSRSRGIKLSAEVKPFVPKYTAVKVAWSEPSEACVFPRYYTTCYPYVQEPPVNKYVYTQDVFWEPTTPLSQYASQNPLGNNLLEEYTSPPYSVDATPNVYSVASFQCENNNPKFYNSSRQDRDYAKQTSLQRKGAASLPRVSDDTGDFFFWLTKALTFRIKSGKKLCTFLLQKPSKSSGKKSQIPVQLDLGNMLAALEQKQCAEKSKQSKPVVLSVGGAVTLLSKESMTVTKSQQLNQGKVPHNPLDSSAPLVKKGKQREVPKAKKPTALRKIILKEREQRKQQHLLEQTAKPQDDAVQQGAETTSEVVSEDSKAGIVGIRILLISSLGYGMPFRKKCICHNTKIIASFFSYCTQVLSKEVDSCVTDLLKELVRFQDRLYQKDPVKAKTKRRLVMGLREVLKHLKLKKLKCVIISPNCEKIQSKGGLDETLHLIIDSACEQNIPFVFALSRKALGHCVNKAVPVSVVGIFSYDGAQVSCTKFVLYCYVSVLGKILLENCMIELPQGQGSSIPALHLFFPSPVALVGVGILTSIFFY